MLIRIAVISAVLAAASFSGQTDNLIQAPRFWNDRDLADWATPIAALDVRPGHFSEREYYAAPSAEWVRTYPVYFPGREPGGYWEMLRKKKPEPLITSGARTAADWITEGARVFDEMDVPAFRTTDPALIAIVRSAEALTKHGGRALKGGTLAAMRWAPTSKGLALTIRDCGTCHTRTMPDGSILKGAPFNEPFNGVIAALIGKGIGSFFPGDTPELANWRQFTVPWLEDDRHASIKSMPVAEFDELLGAIPPGAFARFNGSPYYPTRVPDLIGLKDRKYIDQTATHRLRGPEDVMRYAALISCCDSADFGRYRVLSDAQRRVSFRMPDELLFALARYVYSLEPPPNPNRDDPRAAAGRQVFERERCGACHAPPLYTNNKLTLAEGYRPPADHPNRADIMPVSVGTDPGLALRTRKATGFYTVPSLRGVWYRGLLGHDGSVASLEDWLDAARLRDDYVPTGFKGRGVTHRAVPGHTFGTSLPPGEKAALIAFLKTL